jgi:asparagine synthase (glutamine-hydrolysing)
MVAALGHQPYRTTYARSTNGAFACVHHGLFDHPVVAATPDRSVGVVLDGWLFGWRANGDARPATTAAPDSASYVLHAYLEQGVDFVRRVNGQFNLLIWDDRCRGVLLINDRYGLRPLQYACLDGMLYLAPEGKAILAGSGRAGELNLRMLVNQLSWGRIWIGQETFFNGVFLLPPASILSWQDGKLARAQYWDYVYRPEPEIDEGFIAHTVATFRAAVARQTRAPLRYGVSLSGGLDSRSVLAAARQCVPGEVRAYSWGVSDGHDEVAIARRTAACLGVPWTYLPLAPADFLAQARRGVFLSEGLDLLVQSYGLGIYPSIRPHADALLSGLALDLTLGGSYLSPALTTAEATPEAACAWALQKATLFAPDECQQLVRLDGLADLLQDLRREALDIWHAGQNAHPADQCDRFFLHTRMWRYIFTRQLWQRLLLEDLAPTFDNELIDCLLRIPAAWRLGHRFYQRFLHELDPRMMDIPYQRTMLPPAAPLEFWPMGTQLEEQREQLYRAIWRATDPRVLVPYRRYFTNYDEWLRHDPCWMAMADDLLLSDHSLSCGRFLHRPFVSQLIADHRAGKKAHQQKLLQLMTLELLLREFFA